MLKSANAETRDGNLEIMCPSLSKEDLEVVVKFLYNGEISCPDRIIANQVFNNLQELFGFPSRNFQFDGTILKSELQDYNVSKICKRHDMI